MVNHDMNKVFHDGLELKLSSNGAHKLAFSRYTIGTRMQENYHAQKFHSK